AWDLLILDGLLEDPVQDRSALRPRRAADPPASSSARKSLTATVVIFPTGHPPRAGAMWARHSCSQFARVDGRRDAPCARGASPRSRRACAFRRRATADRVVPELASASLHRAS